MNILIINYEYPPLGGGGGVATKSLAEELVRRGHQIIVLTSHYSGYKFKEEIAGVKIYRVPVLGRSNMQKASMLSMLTWPIGSIIAGFLLCRKEKFDLINTHFFSPTGPTGYILSILFKLPNIIYAHGGDVYNPENMNKTPSGKGVISKLLRYSLNLQSKQARGILVQSSDTKKRILHINKNLENKISVIALPFSEPPIDLSSIKINKKKSEVNIISMGRLVERKGFNYLVSAMTKLPQKFKLTIIGEGPERENLANQIDRLDLKDRVCLTGFVSEKEKYELLLNADIYVLSSLHEGMGIVVQEAMYAGLPVIATNEGGQIDLIQDEENGILIPPRDITAIAEAVKELARDKKKMDQFSIENKKRIEKYFAEKIGEEYERYFEQISN